MWFLLWPMIGLLSMVGLLFILHRGPIDEITLGDAFNILGSIFMGTVFGPITFIFAIVIAWDKFELANVTLWKQTPLDLQKEAKKRGYELKPLKGMDDV